MKILIGSNDQSRVAPSSPRQEQEGIPATHIKWPRDVKWFNWFVFLYDPNINYGIEYVLLGSPTTILYCPGK